jgi:hypothetical protein
MKEILMFTVADVVRLLPRLHTNGPPALVLVVRVSAKIQEDTLVGRYAYIVGEDGNAVRLRVDEVRRISDDLIGMHFYDMQDHHIEIGASVEMGE